MGLVTKVNRAYRKEEVAVRFQERALALHTPFGGGEIRPTRAFLWLGDRNRGRELIYPLGRPPRPLRAGRRRRYLDFGSWGLAVLGNPVVTVGQFAYYFVKRP